MNHIIITTQLLVSCWAIDCSFKSGIGGTRGAIIKPRSGKFSFIILDRYKWFPKAVEESPYPSWRPNLSILSVGIGSKHFGVGCLLHSFDISLLCDNIVHIDFLIGLFTLEVHIFRSLCWFIISLILVFEFVRVFTGTFAILQTL